MHSYSLEDPALDLLAVLPAVVKVEEEEAVEVEVLLCDKFEFETGFEPFLTIWSISSASSFETCSSVLE